MRGFGFWSRFTFGAQVVLALVLAIGAAVLAIDLSDWKYVRVDLSASGRNTLDPAVIDIVDSMPEPVVVDVFFRALGGPYQGVSLQAQNRMLELLSVATRSRRHRMEVRVHDPGDFEETKLRQEDLGVEGQNLVVYTCGGRKAVQHLFEDIAVVDWGNPTREYYEYLTRQGIAGAVDPRTWNPDSAFRGPQLSVFRGEEALAEALLKVASGTTPRVYFSKGQGEPSLYGTLTTDLGQLRKALERDGFEVLEWDPSATPAVPEDCEVLALVGSSQPFPRDTIEQVREFLKRGGRVVAAPGRDEIEEGARGGIVELLEGYGMDTVPGMICEPVVDTSGQKVDGHPLCADFYVDEHGFSRSHPLTEPLIRRGRRVRFAVTASFERPLDIASGGTLRQTLVSSSADSWRDLQPYDLTFDKRTEERGRYALCMLAEVSTPVSDDSATARKGRLLGIASSTFLLDGLSGDNRDFLLNAFNWMAEREHRIRVAPLEHGRAFLDLQRGAALPVLTFALWLGLPGLCVAIGGFLAWRRRS